MSDNVIDLDERREVVGDERAFAELARRVDQATERFGRWLVDHAAEMLAHDVLIHDDKVMDHIWYLRRSHGEAILEWARHICPGDESN